MSKLNKSDLISPVALPGDVEIASVNVILSTHNGEIFLPALLDSLLSQTLSSIELTVRDDGSSDRTRDILDAYKERFANVRIEFGENLGVFRSFFAALQNANPNCDYYAFCDQDDVWNPDKLERAVSRLASLPSNIPSLYCSRLEYVDAELNHIDYLPIPRFLSIKNALVQNVAIGCTIVLNRTARELLIASLPERVIMHDWWFYLVIAALGRIVYDDMPTIKYRQHGRNVVGGTTNKCAQMVQRLDRFQKFDVNAVRLTDQAKALLDCHGPALRSGDLQFIERFVASKRDLRSRIAYLLELPVVRQTRLETLGLGAMILLGRY